MTQPSHWEQGHILSLGTSGGRWHLPRKNAVNVGLCGKFGYRQEDRFAAVSLVRQTIDSIVELGTAPMCLTCQHIRRSK